MASPVGLRPITGYGNKTRLVGRLVVSGACQARLIPNVNSLFTAAMLAAFRQKRHWANCTDLPRHICQHTPGK
jgi:hypothetical protein